MNQLQRRLSTPENRRNSSGARCPDCPQARKSAAGWRDVYPVGRRELGANMLPLQAACLAIGGAGPMIGFFQLAMWLGHAVTPRKDAIRF
jgi:hypothetical protein